MIGGAIEVELTAKDQDLVRGLIESGKRIDKLKYELADLAVTASRSFREAAEEMKKSFAAATLAAVPRVETEIPGVFKPDPQALALAKQEIIQYNKDMAIAVSQSQTMMRQELKLTANAEKQVIDRQKKVAQTVKTTSKEVKESTTIWQRFGKAIQSLFVGRGGRAGGFMDALVGGAAGGAIVAALIVGLNALKSALNSVINVFRNAMKAGEEFALSIFKLGAAMHALQRIGLNVTIAETIKLIKTLREEYGIFTLKEVVGGVSNMMLLTRNFQLTQEQMKMLLSVSADLAVVLGKDMNEAARELALFISSGYGEALQRAGISVNRLSVTQEAWRMGIKKSYMALTELERGQAAVNLIQKFSNDLHSDAIGYQKQIIGQIDASRAKIQNYKDALGLFSIQFELVFYTMLASVIDFAQGFYKAYEGTIAPIFTKIIVGARRASWEMSNFGKSVSHEEWAAAMKKIVDETQNMVGFLADLDLSKLLEGFADITAAAKEAENTISDELLVVIEKLAKDLPDTIKDASLEAFQALEDFIEEYGRISEDELKNVLDSWDDYFSSVAGMSREEFEESKSEILQYYTSIGSITQEGLDKAFEIWSDYWEKIADIQARYDEAIANAQEDYAKGLAELQANTTKSIAEANRKYRENEEKAERDHQERMRRLREEFQFDLEEALRERDAVQILRLMRRYKLDKEQANREAKLRTGERKETHQEEIEKIRENEAEKRQALLKSYQEQLADAEAARAKAEAEAKADREEALNDLYLDLKEDREKRKIEYEKEVEDLKARLSELVKELIGELIESGEITGDLATKIGEIVTSIFGENGLVAGAYGFAKENIALWIAEARRETEVAMALQQQIVQAVVDAQLKLQQLQAIAQQMTITPWGTGAPTTAHPPPGWQPPTPQPDMPGYASGGSLLLTRPQLFMAGEVPERIDITPLSQLNTGGGGGNGNGQLKLELWLSPDLEYRVVDKALNDMAGIITEVRRAK